MALVQREVVDGAHGVVGVRLLLVLDEGEARGLAAAAEGHADVHHGAHLAEDLLDHVQQLAVLGLVHEGQAAHHDGHAVVVAEVRLLVGLARDLILHLLVAQVVSVVLGLALELRQLLLERRGRHRLQLRPIQTQDD